MIQYTVEVFQIRVHTSDNVNCLCSWHSYFGSGCGNLSSVYGEYITSAGL
jgi:hypothetical protein